MKTADPLRLDPTRTGDLRKRFMADMFHRFERLKRAIRAEMRSSGLITNAGGYEFLSDADKVRKFNVWLKQQVAAGVLQTTGPKDDPWTLSYVREAYRRGQSKAFDKVRRPELGTKQAKYQGTKEEFLRHSFQAKVATEKVRLLATRSYEELNAISAQMGNAISRELVFGLLAGNGADEIAEALVEQVDGMERGRARTLARTEIVYAHAEGSLDAFQNLGVEEVGAEVEFSTADDNIVCPKCDALNGEVYTIQQARGRIPVHPNCRCSWLPHFSEDEEEE